MYDFHSRLENDYTTIHPSNEIASFGQVIIINDNYYPSLSHFIIHFIFLVVQLENDPKQVVGCGCKSLEKEDYYALLLTSFADIPGV